MKVPKPVYFLAALLLIVFCTACQKNNMENSYLVSTYAGGKTSGYLSGSIDSVLFGGPNNIAIDTKDNLYVTDLGNHIIRKITPEGKVIILAGEGNSFADGMGRAAKFNYPLGITVDVAGIIYVADRENQRVRKILPDGMVSTLAGNGITGSDDGSGKVAQFYNPVGVAVDDNGNIYVADSENHRIRKISPNGIVSTVAGTTRGFADGEANVARFNNPVDVAIDVANNIFVVDRNNNCIRKIAPDGTVSTLAGNNKPGFADGYGKMVQFNGPRGIAVDKDGNIYISDSGNNSIRKIASNGKVSTIAGSGTAGFIDGKGKDAQFNDPWGIAIDKNSSLLYVADRNNLRIRKIELNKAF